MTTEADEVGTEEPAGTVVIDARKGTVFVERKVNLEARGAPKYDSLTLGVHIPFEIPPGTDALGVHGLAKDAFFQAKGIVMEQAGLEFEVTDDGVIMEVIKKNFGQVEQVASTPATTEAAPAASGERTCEGCGGTSFYDNTAKKASGEYKANAPDFKCKGCAKGVWLKKKGA